MALNITLKKFVLKIPICLIKSDKASTSNMKIDTLNFLNNLLSTHDEKLFHLYIDVIVQVTENILNAIKSS